MIEKDKNLQRLRPMISSMEKRIPSHAQELPRLRRVKGQLDGVERMIAEGRYCVDILHQIKAARVALKSLENSVLKTHLKGCVRGVLSSTKSCDVDEKIQEILDLLGK